LVPATIDVDLVVRREHTVASSAFWRIVEWRNLLPALGLKVEAVQVIVGDSLIVQTSVTTEQVDLSAVQARTAVGSGSWCTDLGLLVGLVGLVVPNLVPFQVFDVEEPGVVQSGLWVMMSSKHEDFTVLVVSGAGKSKMLSSGERFLIATYNLLDPFCFF